VRLNAEGHLFLAEGDYGRDSDGTWMVRPPRSGAGMLDEGWQVTEHDDGTISATPSIDTGTWHGFLVHGEWREC
jgi:hypothetical protein